MGDFVPMGGVLRRANSTGDGRSRTLRGLGLAGILLAGAAFVSAEPIKKKFSTAANPSLSLRNHYGSIVVKSWEQNEIEIQGERSSDGMQVVILGGEQKVSVQTHPVRERISLQDARVDFQIRVPRQATVRIDSERGNLSVENIEGNVAVEAVSTVVELSHIRGHISVHTVDGPIRIQSSEGDHIEAHSISGSLKFVGVNCHELVAKTNSGAIQYEGDFGAGGNYVLNNYNSPIEIVASDKASFDFTARAVEGAIESNLVFRPIPLGVLFRRPAAGRFLQGRFQTGDSTVQVTSYSGTIRVRGPRPQPGMVP